MKKSDLSKPEYGFDLISNMLDSILVSILSRLGSTEEAIRSSILSRRWMHLWTAIPSLDMCFEDIRYGGDFKEFVYWVLARKSKTVDLDSFRICCDGHYTMSTVCRWIHMAVRRNVKQLNLSFYPYDKKTKHIELPHCLVICDSLEVLRLDLRYHGLRLPKVMGFPALRALHLTYVDLMEDDDLVKGFLQSCTLLEDLSLLHCITWKLDLLCISCMKLKRLSIINWEHDGCRDIKISCPKLVDLDLTGYIACKIFFEGLHSLKKAVFEPILEGNTEEGLHFLCECIDGACDLALPNLKTLVLETTMDAFTVDELIRIRKYCPKLESLKLSITKENSYADYSNLDEVNIRRILTPDVKKVEFFEFNGEKPKLVVNTSFGCMDIVARWGNQDSYSP